MHTNADNRDHLATEFPGYANVRDGADEAEPIDDDPAAAAINRRSFLALAAATGLAGMVGCRRPDLQILPYSAIPDDQLGHLAPGRPTFYATCLPRAGGALPVLVESHDGRPTKVEGNPRHPASGGSTDIFAQAAVLDLYSPDRVMSDRYPGVMEKGAPRRWEDFDRLARTLADAIKKNGGEDFYVLAEQVPSPALRIVREQLKKELNDHLRKKDPKAADREPNWHTYEPVDTTEALRGAEVAFGARLVAKYNFDEIDCILALDSDFLGNDPNAVEYSRAFAARRKVGWREETVSAIVLHINSEGKVVVPRSEGKDSPRTLDSEAQLKQHLTELTEIEQRKTGSRPSDLRVILVLEKAIDDEKYSSIVQACRAVGLTHISFQRPPLNRLYVVESTYTVTGTMADHRLRLPASQIGGYLLALAKELKVAGLPTVADSSAYPEKWVKAVAKDLLAKKGKSAVIVGHRQPAWVHALAHAVNASLNATPDLVALRTPPPELTEKGIRELTRDMAAGKVQTLVIIGGNPVFNAPADANFKSELQKVSTKIRLGLFFDQTSDACDWHLPLAHPLESWGDSETSDGTLCCVQPLIAPLNGSRTAGAADIDPPPRGGRTPLEVLALLTQFKNPEDGKPVGTFFAAQKAAYAAVKKVFSDRAILDKGETPDAAFNKYKQLGFLPQEKDKAARRRQSAEAKPAQIAAALAGYAPTPAPTKDALEVTFHPDSTLHDGRFAMNPWLQEVPDPITKLVWDNAAVISPATAAAFGVGYGDRVKLTVNGVSLDIPVYVLPGQADYSIALAYGQYGEMRIDRVPDGGGTNVYPARKGTGFHTALNCRLEKTGKKADLVQTQEHGVIPEGRAIIGEYTFAQYSKLGHEKHGETKSGHGQGQGHGHGEGPKIGVAPDGHIAEDALRKEFQGGYGNKQQPPAPATDKQQRFPLDLARPELLDSQFQWGMTIDLSACTGCTACLIACQTENNIPVVGKQEVKRNRELHWIRIDRYFSSDGHTAHAEPTIVNQPVACVHCEAAPCEQVCPVNAALHSPEGLNLQVYNRCIGTRYCANACPYKVRRFNWFDFNKRGLDELRTPTPFAKGGSSFSRNLMPETLQMQKNPDVTVRMRGVMEKCTYCVQRIERGKYGAKIAAAEVADGRRTIETDAAFKADGPATAYRKPKNPQAAGYDLDRQGRVIVPDGVIVTACQAACPSQAITFGNVLDPTSAVSKAKARAGEYLLLGELNTKPRTSFLPRVRNVNPEMG